MKFSKKILDTFIKLPNDWQELMESVGLEVKSVDPSPDGAAAGGDIMNLELLANRGDHYCYLGLASEIAGRLGMDALIKPKKRADYYLPVYDTEPTWVGGENPGEVAKIKDVDYAFEIETEKCLAYSLTPYKKTSRKSTLADYKYMLESSGINAIAPIIDITNVVLLEHGHPSHIYDADKIVGKMRIRDSKPHERAALLFHDEPVELPVGTCVIADDEKILCVGGVIGCYGADVDENTKNILFETALFDPVAIRKAERAILEKPTLAAQIFERGGDWDLDMPSQRAKKLYTDAGWDQSGDFQWAVRFPEYRVINLPGDFVRRELEINISDAEINERLERYGFYNNKKCNPDLAKSDHEYIIPGWRKFNVRVEPQYLIEELARSIGYDNLPRKLPPVITGAAMTWCEKRRAEIDSYLAHNGFFEVITDSMYSPKHAAASPIADHIALQNSVEGGYAFMRNNAIVQATELVAKNINVKNRNIRAFEWGKVFQKNGEHDVLWGVMNGPDVNALTAKGLLENLMHDLGIDYTIEYGTLAKLYNNPDRPNCIHPNRCGRISRNGVEVCIFGEIHPELRAEFDIKNDTPVFFEFFDVGEFLNIPPRKTKYVAPSAIIPSTRDISIAVPYGSKAGDVAAKILADYPAVARAEITDVFDKPKEQSRNITFTLTFRGEHSADDLNKMILEMMKTL